MSQKIQKTINYNQFTLHKMNRKVNYSKVEKLAAEIKEGNNQLHLFPAIVNADLEILDGQHRFLAAKEAEVYFFYMIDDNYSIAKVPGTNNFQNAWKIDDYVLYYASEGKEHYKNLLHISSKYDISPGIIGAVDGQSSFHAYIREGKFQFANYKKVCEILEYAVQFNKQFSFNQWRHRSFLKAIRHIMKVKDFDKETMLEAVKAKPKLLIHCHEADEYINLLESIYCMHTKTEIRFL